MTWLQFKTWMESSGVRDTDPIWFLDVSPKMLKSGVGCVHVCRDAEYGVYVTHTKGVPPR